MNRCLLYLLLLGSLFSQQSLDSLFKAGNQYYESGDYEKALSIYSHLSETVNQVDVFYNMGNAYYRLGNLGESIWAWEKGQKISPRHKDIIYNLTIANSKVKDRIEPPEGFLLLNLYRAFIEKNTISALIGLGSLIILLFSIVYGVGILRPGWESRLTPIKILLLVIIFTIHGLALDRYWKLSEIKAGIVLNSRVDVRSAPIKHPKNVIFRIHEGVKVEITQTQPGWIEIILLDGKKGWLNSSAIKSL